MNRHAIIIDGTEEAELIKTVVFDIGKVLIGFDWDEYVRSLFNEETAQKVTHAMFGSSSWHELDRAVLSEEEIVGLFHNTEPEYCREIDEAFERVGECVARRDWVIPLIDSIKERGYRVVYLSNMSEHVIASNPRAFDFTDHMDGGIYSYEVHYIKPEKEIYEKLFEKYSLKPEECLFIDDIPANVAEAKRLGMKAIRYMDPEQLAANIDQALTKDKNHDRLSVVCYGDSNTYGFDPNTGSRYQYDKRWTTLLGEKLGAHYEVIPEGLNGRTTAYDRPGAGWKNGVSSFIACLGTHKPVDYLIIMLGTNDCNAGLGLSAEDIAKGMENLVELAEEKSPELQGYIPQIVVTVPPAISEDFGGSPFAWELSPESVQKSKDIAPLYRDIAERHGCLFADASEGIEVSADCMHLTEKGHTQISDLLYKIISE